MLVCLARSVVKKLWPGAFDPAIATELRAAFPATWRDIARSALLVDLRFYVLLWQRRYEEARFYAERMAELSATMGLARGRWLERQGDASLYKGDYLDALTLYQKGLSEGASAKSAYLKLSDTYFQLGDLELERLYREKIYGSLRPE